MTKGKKNLATAAVAVALLAWASLGSIQAQQQATGQAPVPKPATVLLKSGERVTGEFQDINDNTVYIRLGLHEDRRIPVQDVALIEFQQPQAQPQARALPQGQQLLVLHDGTTVTGQFVDVVGAPGSPTEDRTPENTVNVVFRTPEGERQYPIQSVQRMHLGTVDDAVATTGAEQQPGIPAEGVEVTVPAQRQWTPTGVYVREGQMVTFNARGQITIREHQATPAGSTQQMMAGPRAPLPGQLAGALIGRIGNQQPFGIGDQTEPLRMPASGMLYLGVNSADTAGQSGEFQVSVRPGQQR
jgi:hypothetical protein